MCVSLIYLSVCIYTHKKKKKKKKEGKKEMKETKRRKKETKNLFKKEGLRIIRNREKTSELISSCMNIVAVLNFSKISSPEKRKQGKMNEKCQADRKTTQFQKFSEMK